MDAETAVKRGEVLGRVSDERESSPAPTARRYAGGEQHRLEPLPGAPRGGMASTAILYSLTEEAEFDGQRAREGGGR